MKKPKIITHMHLALDGKINGPHLSSPESEKAQKIYYDLMLGEKAAYKKHRGRFCGTETSRVICDHRKPDLSKYSDLVEEGDYIADSNAGMYYFTLDNHGELDREGPTFKYFDTVARIVMFIPNSVSGKYKNFLRERGISYLICGEDRVDLKLAVEKLMEYFPMEEFLVNGGGGVNYSFLQQGLIDELSLVITPVADGSPNSTPLFYANEKYSKPEVFGFDLIKAEVLEDDTVRLRYRVK